MGGFSGAVAAASASVKDRLLWLGIALAAGALALAAPIEVAGACLTIGVLQARTRLPRWVLVLTALGHEDSFDGAWDSPLAAAVQAAAADISVRLGYSKSRSAAKP